MSFDLGNLNAYVNENIDNLFTKSKLQATIFKYVDVQKSDSKGQSIALTSMETNLNFGANTCDVSATGSTNFNQRYATMGDVSADPEWCTADLNDYFLSVNLPDEVVSDLGYLEGLIAEQVAEDISLNMQNMLLFDNATSGTEGIVDIIEGDADTISAGTGSITDGASANAAIQAVITSRPAAMRNKETIILCSYATLDHYQAYLIEQNYFNYKASDDEFEQFIPGKPKIKLVAVEDFDATPSKLTATYPGNIKMVSVGSYDKFEFTQDVKGLKVLGTYRARVGFQVYEPGMCVYWTEA